MHRSVNAGRAGGGGSGQGQGGGSTPPAGPPGGCSHLHNPFGGGCPYCSGSGR